MVLEAILNKPIYHIIDINNLQSILNEGAILSYNTKEQKNIVHVNIAYQNIQDWRDKKEIDKTLDGTPITLHDCVPFYFCPRSPMLYLIYRNNTENYNYHGGQENIIHIVLSTDIVVENNLEFQFTDGHTRVEITEFYTNICDLSKLDWGVIDGNYWFDNKQYPDRKRRKQAEFLVYNTSPILAIIGIGVYNNAMLNKAIDIIQKAKFNIDVKIRPGWYY